MTKKSQVFPMKISLGEASEAAINMHFDVLTNIDYYIGLISRYLSSSLYAVIEKMEPILVHRKCLARGNNKQTNIQLLQMYE
jgi:hypothetical protein